MRYIIVGERAVPDDYVAMTEDRPSQTSARAAACPGTSTTVNSSGARSVATRAATTAKAPSASVIALPTSATAAAETAVAALPAENRVA